MQWHDQVPTFNDTSCVAYMMVLWNTASSFTVGLF